MESTRATWTDERLDDLARRVDRGFARVDDDLRSLRSDMNDRFNSLEGRLDSLQRLIIQVGGGLTVAVLAAVVGTLAS